MDPFHAAKAQRCVSKGWRKQRSSSTKPLTTGYLSLHHGCEPSFGDASVKMASDVLQGWTKDSCIVAQLRADFRRADLARKVYGVPISLFARDGLWFPLASIMKNTEYSRVSSPLESRDSTSDGDDDEGQTLLLRKTPSRVSCRPMRNFMIILSSLNIIVFSFSSLLFGTWFYNNYLVLNANFRRTSAYSKTPIS